MHIDFALETDLSRSARVKQLAAMFDVPPAEKAKLRFAGELPIDDPTRPWSVGLIVGPSGSGKSSVMRHVWGEPPPLEWTGKSVVDDFDQRLSMEEISAVCQAVGFNTVPAWMRPYRVLSNGERFRVEIARRLLETPADRPIVLDEFTSVVDRQVAKIGSHAVQKWVRKNGRRFVAVTCHYDVIDWLQPDWILEPGGGELLFIRRSAGQRPFDQAGEPSPSAAGCPWRFEWRLPGPRPRLAGEIHAADRAVWRLFRLHHYMSADLSPGCRAFVLTIDGQPVAFAAILNFPHARRNDLRRVHRVVVLPDWQGLGVGMMLLQRLGAAHRAAGLELRLGTGAAHFARTLRRSAHWQEVGRGVCHRRNVGTQARTASGMTTFGGRPISTYRYTGPADAAAAETLLSK